MTDRSDLLASCLNAIESGESTIEDCIKEQPEIAGLLRVAMALRAQPEIKMAEAPKLALERRLGRLMDERSRRAAPARRWRWLRVVAFLAALLVVVFGLGAGLAQLARPAIPGDVLYAYKRVIERVELSFASGATQSDMLTYIAAQRLDELKLLALRGQPLEDSLLADLKDSLNAAIAAQSSPQARLDLYNAYIRELASAAQIDPVNASVLKVAMDSITKPSADTASVATSTATPSPTVTRSATPSYTPSALPTLSPTAIPTDTGTPSPTLTPSVTQNQPLIVPSATPSPTYTPSYTPTQTPPAPPAATPTTIILPSVTPQPTVTLTPIILPSPTPILLATVMVPFIPPTNTPLPTLRPSSTPTVTPHVTATSTPTPTTTSTLPPCGPLPTVGPEHTGEKMVDMLGNTLTPTNTPTPCASWTPSPTSTPSETATVTPTATPSETETDTPLPTPSRTPSRTVSPTESTPEGTAEGTG